MEEMRRTKIVATLGPATRNPEILAGVIKVGADVLRLNFSHGTREEHAELVEIAREASRRAGREVGLLGDLPGPKIRLGEIEGDVLHLRHGQSLTLTTDARPSERECLPVAWAGLPQAVGKNDVIYLADGSIRLRVTDTQDGEVGCKVETGGTVTSHQGLNLPGAEAVPASAGESDLDWVDFAIDHGVDLLAVSFVRTAADLEPVNARLAERGVDTPVIAKIEKREAVADAEEIVQETYIRVLKLDDLSHLDSEVRRFLFRIATNLARDRFRQRKARAHDAHVPFDMLELEGSSEAPEEIVDWDAGMVVLKQALLDLPPRHRQVFLLHVTENMSYRTIAKHLGVSTKTVERDLAMVLELCQSRLRTMESK